MEDKKDQEYFKDPQRTAMSGQAISKPGEAKPAVEPGEKETTTGEGNFQAEKVSMPYADKKPQDSGPDTDKAGKATDASGGSQAPAPSGDVTGADSGRLSSPYQDSHDEHPIGDAQQRMDPNRSIVEPGVSPASASPAEMGGPGSPADAPAGSRDVSGTGDESLLPPTTGLAPTKDEVYTSGDPLDNPAIAEMNDEGGSGDRDAGSDGVFLADTEPAQIPVDVQHFERPDASHLRDYIGMSVINREGESLGSIEDVHSHGGHDYIVLDYGDKLFAVPVNALEYIPEEKIFIIDKSRQELEKAPGYDRDKGPQFEDMHWNTRLHEFYSKNDSPNQQ